MKNKPSTPNEFFFANSIPSVLSVMVSGYGKFRKYETERGLMNAFDLLSNTKDFNKLVDDCISVYVEKGKNLTRDDIKSCFTHSGIDIKYTLSVSAGSRNLNVNNLEFSRFELLMSKCSLIEKDEPIVGFNQAIFEKEIRPLFKELFDEQRGRSFLTTDARVIKQSAERFKRFSELVQRKRNVYAVDILRCDPYFLSFIKENALVNSETLFDKQVRDVGIKFEIDAISQEVPSDPVKKTRKLKLGR